MSVILALRDPTAPLKNVPQIHLVWLVKRRVYVRMEGHVMLPMVSVCVQLDSLVPSVVSDAPLVFMVRTANTTAIVIITMAIVIMYLASVSVYQDLQERPVNSNVQKVIMV